MSNAAAKRRQKQLARTVYDYGAIVFGNPASRPDGNGGNAAAIGDSWTFGGEQPSSITRADDGHDADAHLIECTPQLFRVISAAAATLKGGDAGAATKKRKRKHKHKHKHKAKHKHKDARDER